MNDKGFEIINGVALRMQHLEHDVKEICRCGSAADVIGLIGQLDGINAWLDGKMRLINDRAKEKVNEK